MLSNKLLPTITAVQEAALFWNSKETVSRCTLQLTVRRTPYLEHFQICLKFGLYRPIRFISNII